VIGGFCVLAEPMVTTVAAAAAEMSNVVMIASHELKVASLLA